MARRKIGEVLVERGVITTAQLEAALAHQRQHGNRLGAALVARRFVSEEQLVLALGEALNLPVVDLSKHVPDWAAIHLLRPQFCLEHEVFPLAVDDHGGRKVVTVAMADPSDTASLEEIAFTTGCKVLPALATRASIQLAVQKFLQKRERPSLASGSSTEPRMALIRPGGGVDLVDTSTHEEPQELAADEVQEAEITRPRPLGAPPKRSSMEDDLGFLFGTDEKDQKERVDRLERRLRVLADLLVQRGVLNRDELKKLFSL